MKILVSSFSDDNEWIESIELDDAQIEDANADFWITRLNVRGTLRTVYRADKLKAST